jgi:hypothetical protein
VPQAVALAPVKDGIRQIVVEAEVSIAPATAKHA